MISSYQRLMDGCLGDADPAKLAAAAGIVNSGIDDPVMDIGLD